jgi:outer membrane PBP1 activator LpoA protein
MDDPLLKRADKAIRDSEAIRDEVRASRLQAWLSTARIKKTIASAREQSARPRQLRTEMADWDAEDPENPTAKRPSAFS